MNHIRGLRWWIIGLIFLATLINFIDRLTVSILGPVIMAQLHLTNAQFGSITAWFLVAYTASQGLSGKLYDRIGSKSGFTISVLVWSIAACLHAFARGPTDLRLLRAPIRARWLRCRRSKGNQPDSASGALPSHPPGDARDGGHRWIQAKRSLVSWPLTVGRPGCPRAPA